MNPCFTRTLLVASFLATVGVASSQVAAQEQALDPVVDAANEINQAARRRPPRALRRNGLFRPNQPHHPATPSAMRSVLTSAKALVRQDLLA